MITVIRDNGPELVLKKGIIEIINVIVSGQMLWNKETEKFIGEYISLVLDVGVEELSKKIEN